jgi:predicted nucleotidyltransferase
MRAWDAARLGAAILRERFGASNVVAFGSLATGRWFGEVSDVDLAASGLRVDDYFAAVAAVQGLLGEFEVDLVDLDRCPAALREVVLDDGVAL